MAVVYNIKGTSQTEFQVGKSGPKLVKNGSDLELQTPGGLVSLSSDLDLNSNKVINLTSGSTTGDAVEYDQFATALALKQDSSSAFSGDYNDLTNKPSVPSSIGDLDNVTLTTPADGDILVYDATNSIWINSVPGSSGSLGLVDLVDVDVTSPANHEYLKYNGSGWVNATIAYSEVSGTPSLSTVATSGLYSDLAGTPDLTAYLLKSGGTMTGTLTLAGAPSGTNDAATKGYVDGVAAGLSFKETVQVTTTGSNITLDNTTTTLDGVAITDGMRVLVKDQTDSSENGIYVASTSGSWARSADADQDAELAGGTSVFVSQGTEYGDCGFVIVSPDGPAIIGTDDILWTQFSSPGVVTIDVGDGLTVTTGPAYTISIDVDSSTITNVGGTGAQLAVRGGSSGQVLKSNGTSTDASWLTIATVSTTGAYSDLSGTPVIGTDIQAWDADLDAIAALTGTSGILKKTAANTWTLDTNTYLTANQSVSLTGDITGTGTTSITTTLANSGVSAGTYKSVTVDVKGRVTAGTNPTTLAGM
ncbi:MAG: hypothetical protein M0R77_21475, partial [Gammaproteobacteria bacterium]|nr:hypothetical protein [Gammaproteobacteria bacterium]